MNLTVARQLQVTARRCCPPTMNRHYPPTAPLDGAEHRAMRDTVRRFIADEITPHHARWERDGAHWRINGQEIFISNGQIADLFLLAVKTDSARGAKGVGLMLAEADRPGFSRGRFRPIVQATRRHWTVRA